MNSYLKHLKVSKEIKRLITGTSIGRDLYWYDQKLKDVLNWKGLWKFLKFSISARKSDEVAGNYNVKRLYNGPAINDGLSASGATVWNYTRLKNPAIIDNNDIIRLMESKADLIINEYKNNIDKIITHPDNESLAKDGTWSGIFLYGVDGEKNSQYEPFFKETYELVDQLPFSKNFGFVLISKLSPGVRITPHCGSSNLRFRYHLGLDIPEPGKVKIRVGTEWKYWEEGKAYGFDDSYEHEVVHDGEKDRVVLIVDAWNPDLTDEEIKIFDNRVFHDFGNR